MKAARMALFLGIFLFLGISGCASVARMAEGEVPRMKPEELKARLDDPAVAVIDVRIPDDWAGSKTKIKGAGRESNDKVPEWALKYPKDKTIVLYCA